MLVGIVNANDNGPKFSSSQYNSSVAEDAMIGTTVLAVQAVDLDAVRVSRVMTAMVAHSFSSCS